MTTSDKSPDPKSTEGGSFLTSKPEVKSDGDTKTADKEAKAGGDTKATGDGKDGKTEGEKPSGAPEKYEDFKLPEGYKFDEPQLKGAQELFKALNLTQEQAQQAVDFYAKNGLQAAEAPYKAWADTQKEWLADIGERFGSKADSVRTDINKAVNNVLPPSLAKSFRTALDITGAGSNPDIVEGLHILLKNMVEGSSVRGNGPVVPKPPGQSERPSAAEAMYPHLVGNRPT